MKPYLPRSTKWALSQNTDQEVLQEPVLAVATYTKENTNTGMFVVSVN